MYKVGAYKNHLYSNHKSLALKFGKTMTIVGSLKSWFNINDIVHLQSYFKAQVSKSVTINLVKTINPLKGSRLRPANEINQTTRHTPTDVNAAARPSKFAFYISFIVFVIRKR